MSDSLLDEEKGDTLVVAGPPSHSSRRPCFHRATPWQCLAFLLIVIGVLHVELEHESSRISQALVAGRDNKNSLVATADSNGLAPSDYHPRPPIHGGTTNSKTCLSNHIPVNPHIPGRRDLSLLHTRQEIPDINTQPGEGFMIQALTAFDGHLHLAYGDSGENSGPLSLHAYQPATGLWTYKGLLGTEELRLFRPYYYHNQQHGVLYTPEIDAHGDERRRQSGVYQLECGTTSQWTTTGGPIYGSAHVYDVEVMPSSDPSTPLLWASMGSRTGDVGRLVVSHNGGTNWTDVYRIPVDPHAFSRIYFIGILPGVLVYVWGRIIRHVAGDDESIQETFARVWYLDGIDLTTRQSYKDANFQNITNLDIAAPPDVAADPHELSPYIRPVIYRNEMRLVAHAFRFGPHLGSYELQGTQLVPADPWPRMDQANRNIQINQNGRGGGSSDGEEEPEEDTTELVAWMEDEQHGHLIVLMECCGGHAGVYRTNATFSSGHQAWEEIVHLDPPADEDRYLSLALLNNDLYLGTAQGNLYVVQEIYQPL